MTNPNERDSLGPEQTIFTPPQQKSAPKRSPNDSLMQQSLNNMNTVGGQNPVSPPGIDETVFHGNDHAVRAFLGEGVAIGNNYRLEKRLGRGGMGGA
ncbi:MAG: hypothetical protein LBN39_10940 [Planctomycetaceae bacterium]|jgi:hypothetical protein|nr:hypothetical protein [Planctomycetaceae bacterium]